MIQLLAFRTFYGQFATSVKLTLGAFLSEWIEKRKKKEGEKQEHGEEEKEICVVVRET